MSFCTTKERNFIDCADKKCESPFLYSPARVSYPRDVFYNFSMTQRHSIQSDVITLVTTNVQERMYVFDDAACARIAIESLYRTQEIHPFFLYAFVVMPNHCHILMKPIAPISMSAIMKSYKRRVSFEIGYPIWQSRFDSRIVHKPLAAREYIHMNPVVAEIVDAPEDFPWSSASGRWDVSPLETEI